jgi:hypothetical protein
MTFPRGRHLLSCIPNSSSLVADFVRRSMRRWFCFWGSAGLNYSAEGGKNIRKKAPPGPLANSCGASLPTVSVESGRRNAHELQNRDRRPPARKRSLSKFRHCLPALPEPDSPLQRTKVRTLVRQNSKPSSTVLSDLPVVARVSPA